MIATQGLGEPSAIFLVTGLDFPDDLAADQAAAAVHGAILLTDGASLGWATATYLADHPDDTGYAIGGAATAADPSATLVMGADRYATAEAVAAKFFARATLAEVATGATFPDALSGGVEKAGLGCPLRLTDPITLSAPMLTYLQATPSVTGVRVFGGSGAVANGELGQI